MERKTRIQQCLQAFSSTDLRTAAIHLLNTLGYQSEKTLDLCGSPEAFLDQFYNSPGRAFRRDKALFDDWKEIHLLFQLTDQELSGQGGLFGANEVSQGLMSSYLFFAVSLTGESYARGKLAQITRQLNRLFPMPVMVLFEYNEKLSIAVINRRRHKRDADKDVLGKVTFIQDISLISPHRGHLDILGSFSLPALAGRTGIHSFDALHAAWEEIFNVELLNKKFYRELSNWYFWAMQNVHFPFDDAEADKANLFSSDEKVREHDAKNLIRLLTRLLFVWFIKEKELIPGALFDSDELNHGLLKHFDPDSRHTQFYKAILQNLFFATLNQTCGKRQFRNQNRQHRNVTTLMRYESYFKDSNAFIEMLESVVPFMNGGLFECLDKPDPTRRGPQGGEVIVYEDGFSDRGDNPLKVPDFLFFGKEKTIDLSGVYGDKKRKHEKVRGIIPLLNNYKFTIVENTPIEQEVALDPELLGKVFENLLASYNPETKTTARKQTGSFYTPRTIVDYMVDESLKAYLNKALCEACPEVTEEDAKEGLDILFSYTEKEHAFTDAEKHALIVAIDDCKILDPACGSGAFPMGILHKLEFILGKLDPHNRMWRDRQIGKVDDTIAVAEQIDDATIRDNTVRELEAQKQDIEEAFSNNDLGYGRKLYLIENCIYGVDIQSIATQVSKLRFFISLIVDQGADRSKDNFGIRPLPNLETKFTAADTLIQIEKPAAQGELFESQKVKALEKELKQIRHNLFNAKTPKTKRKYRLRDKELREEIADELEKIGWTHTSARQLSQWDPYDQNASCPFFDTEWMYGITDGFDIVIGNPPYVSHDQLTNKKNLKSFSVYEPFADLYCYFIEKSVKLTSSVGVTCLITSNSFIKADYGKPLRKFLADVAPVDQLLNIEESQVFEAAIVNVAILLAHKGREAGRVLITNEKCVNDDFRLHVASKAFFLASAAFKGSEWILIAQPQLDVHNKMKEQGKTLAEMNSFIRLGLATGANEAFIISRAQAITFIEADPRNREIIKPILRGREIDRYIEPEPTSFVILAKNGVNVPRDYPEIYRHLDSFGAKFKKRGAQGQNWWNLRACAFYDKFKFPKVVWIELTDRARFTYCDKDEMCLLNSAYFLIPAEGASVKFLTGILNSKCLDFFFNNIAATSGMGTTRWINAYVKQLPIPSATKTQQSQIERLVEQIRAEKNKQPISDVATIEAKIDQIVYKLYGLSIDEIAIVEGQK